MHLKFNYHQFIGGHSLKKFVGVKYLVAFGILLVLILIGGYQIIKTPQSTEANTSISRTQKYYFSQIKDVGGSRAYQDLKRKDLVTFQNPHQSAHIFGQALFRVEGKKGISVCDSNFAFGCYHGFIIEAIKKTGLKILPDLNQECIAKNGETETGCRHGIGHGILEYLGHNNLKKALEICESWQKVNIEGCTQGVFMEYNTPFMIDSNDQFLGLRELKNENEIHSPCADLPSKFLNSCYYQQSQWWKEVLKSDYQRVGKLCESLEREDTKRSCFLGVGIVASESSDYNVAKTIHACSRMPSLQSQIDCRSSAGWVFKINPKHTENNGKLCSGLNEQDTQTCLNNAISPDQLFI